MFRAVPLLLIACAPTFEVVDRADGDRTPRQDACDEVDPGRCLLPWPSNTFAVVDETRATGLALRVDPSTINPQDDAASLARADGFSRVSPVLAYFPRALDPATLDAIHVFLMQHDHPDRGREVALRVETIALEDGQSLLVADPREVLEPGADYAVVITNALRYVDGSIPGRSRASELSLEAIEPASAEDAAVVGYFAPLRALLDELAIDRTEVLSMWDFTTRSAGDARAVLTAMRDAAVAADTMAMIDRVTIPTDARIAMIVEGRLAGVPTFLRDGAIALEDGRPVATAIAQAPFRILVPAGTGDYRFVMYGHGTAGNQYDPAFDGEIAELGAAKVGVRLYGWTDADVITTFAELQYAFQGSHTAAAFLAEALAHAAAIERAMSGALGDALSADTIASMPNPAAGRRPDGSIPMWVGGSLGGTTGLVYSAMNAMRYSVLNVPGAAWSQWVWDSWTFDVIHDLLARRYEDDLDLFLALAIAQTNLDMVDGTAWTDVLETSILIQESIGDPILPNQGSEMVAVSARARMVGAAIDPIPGIESAAEVIEGSAITQFRTADTDEYAIHGFGDRDAPAGRAAREQIRTFLESAWAGQSRIVVPSTCDPSCDFGGE